MSKKQAITIKSGLTASLTGLNAPAHATNAPTSNVLGLQHLQQTITDLQTGSSSDMVDVAAIRPDPNQARKMLTPALYQRLRDGANPVALLTELLAVAEHPNASPSLKRRVVALKELAHSLVTTGLLHNIVIRRMRPFFDQPMKGIQHLIVAGERRWWAHIYLQIQGESVLGQNDANKIRAAHLPDDANFRVAQLAENFIRVDLDGLERARSLLALKDELGGNDATWEQVEARLGISRQYRWRVGLVLQLPQEAQEVVEWYGLGESTIRPITQKLSGKPELQIIAMNQLAAWLNEADEGEGQEAVAAKLGVFVAKLAKGDMTPNNFAANEPGQADVQVATAIRKLGSAFTAFGKLDDAGVSSMRQAIQTDEKSRQKLIDLRDRLNKVLS